jgi:FtsH-binding integral membrane protein
MASLMELHPALGSSVALAFIITSLLLTVGYKYAMNTKYDLYALYKYLFPVLIGLIVFSIAGMIFTLPGIFYLFLSLVGAGMFFLYLITDIQTLLSKETQNTPEIIAITLLIDILGLFKNILFLLDGLDD